MARRRRGIKATDVLLLGGAALAALYFLGGKQQVPPAGDGGGIDLSGLTDLVNQLTEAVRQLARLPYNLQTSIAANNAAATAARWLAPSTISATTLGFTSFGAYSSEALQANPVALPEGKIIGQQVAELGTQTGPSPYGGKLPGQTGPATIGTAYTSAGKAAPVLVVPTANFGGKGADLYTTLDVAVGQKAAQAGVATVHGAYSANQLASAYARGLI